MHKVYSIDVSNLDILEHMEIMSPKRIEKINRTKNEAAKKLSMGAELVLIEALKNEISDFTPPINWDTDENGKLYLTDYDFYVNLSHSGTIACCIISDRQCGIDIQYMRDTDFRLAKRFYTDDENEFIDRSVDKKSAFYEIWTKKESYVKAAGKGLGIPLSSFSVFKMTNCMFEMIEIGGGYKLCVCLLL